MSGGFDLPESALAPFLSDPWSVWNTCTEANGGSRPFDHADCKSITIDLQRKYPRKKNPSVSTASVQRSWDSIRPGIPAAKSSNYNLSPLPHRSDRSKPTNYLDTLTDSQWLPTTRNSTTATQPTRSSTFSRDNRAQASSRSSRHRATARDDKPGRVSGRLEALEMEYSYSEISAWSFKESENGLDEDLIIDDESQDTERKVGDRRSKKTARRRNNRE